MDSYILLFLTWNTALNNLFPRPRQTVVRLECSCFWTGTVGKHILQRTGSMLSPQ